MLCPCTSNKKYDDCCAPYILGNHLPKTPEQLMRSRYTAYSQANIDYILTTMQGNPLKNFNTTSAKQWAESVTWLKLKVIRTYVDPAKPELGFVEFKAYFCDRKQTHVMHEFSKFKKIDQQWFYIGEK